MPRGRPHGSTFFDKHPDIRDAVEAFISQRDLSAPQVMELLAPTFGTLPTLRTLRREIARIKAQKPALLASFLDPDRYRSQYRPALGRADQNVDSAHQIWELDTTPADVHTTEGRKAILGCIDRFSRRVRFIVADSESALSVRTLLVSTMRAWGVMPNAVMVDNGSGYINKSLQSALPLLGIEQMICPPGSPEKKPHIERVFQTLQHQRLSMLPGFAGHNVAEAQKLRARAKKETGRAVIEVSITPDDLQAVIDAWTDATYSQRVHAGIGMTPLAKEARSASRPRKAPGEDTLRMVLSDFVGHRTVGKRGVEWKRGRYWHAELAGLMGCQVHVRRDENDNGELLIFDDRDNFICVASNAMRAGMSDEAFAKAADRQMKAHMSAERAGLREKQRRFGLDEAVRDVLRHEAEQSGKLVQLPRAADRYETDVTRSIEKTPVAAKPLPDMNALQAEARRKTSPHSAGRAPSAAERVRETDRVLAAHARGETVDDAALRRARLYADGSAYRAEKMVEAHFQRSPSSQPQQRKENRA